jgi:hypothetical protein
MTTEATPAAAPEAAPNVPESTTPNTPAPEANAPVEGQQPSAERTESDPAQKAERESPEQDTRKSASGRISQLYAEKKTAEARAIAAEREAQQLRADLAKIRQTPMDNLTHEEAERLRLQEVMKSERLEDADRRVEAERTELVNRRAETFSAKVDAARDRMPDFDQVFHGGLPITDTMADLIVESDRAAEVAYWLGKNPNDAARIAHLPPHKQGAEIARIEARLSTVSNRKTSNAPTPPPVLSGQTAPGTKDPASMTMAEYAKWRTAQMKASS